MPSLQDRFVRVPSLLLEALLRTRLTGAQWRVLLWVIRRTDGWNRDWTPFTWYRMAKDLALDRPATYRARQALLQARVLILAEGRLAVQRDTGLWDGDQFAAEADGYRQLWMPGMSAAREQRSALSPDNATVAGRQRKRCQQATVFRRAKDSSKERLKTYKDTGPVQADRTWRRGLSGTSERRHLAGAAQPVPGKYDRVSQN